MLPWTWLHEDLWPFVFLVAGLSLFVNNECSVMDIDEVIRKVSYVE